LLLFVDHVDSRVLGRVVLVDPSIDGFGSRRRGGTRGVTGDDGPALVLFEVELERQAPALVRRLARKLGDSV
jgi:hypothetical protein